MAVEAITGTIAWKAPFWAVVFFQDCVWAGVWLEARTEVFEELAPYGDGISGSSGKSRHPKPKGDH